jgi:phosphoserine phosphatase RsbU/P
VPQELTAARLARLAALSVAAATRATSAEVADLVLEAASAELGATGGGVGLRDPSTGLIHLIVDHGYPDTARAAYPSPARATFPLADAFALGQPIWVEDRAGLEAAYPVLAEIETAISAGCWLPMGPAPTDAVVGLVFDADHVFDAGQRAFLLALAAVGALAIGASRTVGGDGPSPPEEGAASAPASAEEEWHRLASDGPAAIVTRLEPDATMASEVIGWAAFTGQDPATAAGQGWLEAVHPQERVSTAELIRSRQSSPGPVSATLRLWHAPTQQWRHVRADFVPVLDEGRTMVELVASFADVDARLTAESQLAGLARLLDSFLTGSPVGFALVDARLRFQLVNETMAAANGLPADQHVGRRPREVSGSLGELIEPLLQRVLDTQTPILGLELSGGPDRSHPRDWLVNYFPVRRPDGSLRGVGATLVDITDRNRAQAQIRELEARQAQDRFRSALDIMRDSVAIDSAVRDDDGRIVDFRIDYLNPVVHDLAGRSRDQLIGATLLELWPGMAGGELFESYIRAVETGEAFIGREVAQSVTVDGEVRVGYYDLQALRFGDGLLICSRDVTHEREASRRLREATIELAVEHRIVERLQQALLPRTLPDAAEFQIAACYNPVDERADLGGDWYDAFRLPDGRIGLSIGDVTGHGLDAAALMAQCRLALRAYAYDDSTPLSAPDPAQVLGRLDQLLAESPTTELATAIYAIYDPTNGQLCWARAGHPLPLVCGPVTRGAARQVVELEASGGPPLGTRLIDTYPSCKMVLEPDAFVLLYTDGLVERRGHLIDDGVNEVKARLEADDWEALATLCDALTESVRAGLTREDDVCILALRRNPVTQSAGPGVG